MTTLFWSWLIMTTLVSIMATILSIDSIQSIWLKYKRSKGE